MANFVEKCWPEILQKAVDQGASDIHLAVNQPLFLRIQGKLNRVEGFVPDEMDMGHLFQYLTNQNQRKIFLESHEIDFAWFFAGQRLRINAFQEQNLLALAIRRIPFSIPTLDELGMPASLIRLLRMRHGLILITGRTGAGKTTTLAAFINALNQSQALHIITLEDPIEYIHTSGTCLLHQREYNTDFLSFSVALRSALREDPDVIVVGELRDADTIAAALNAAETAHLVLASLHTQNAAETVLRIESFFPAEQQAQIRTQLSITLAAIFSQQLLPSFDSQSRVCAVEALVASPAIRNLIRTGKVQQIKSSILSGVSLGMQTMEKAIADLARQQKISSETAQCYLGSEEGV